MLGDFITKLFTADPVKWKTLTEKDKEGFFIILNRMMSIKHPLIANEMNVMYINKSRAVDWWHEIMSRQYFKAPGWIWTKTKFETDNKNKDKSLEDFDEKIMKKYLEHNQISKKDLKEAYKLFKVETMDELGRFEEFTKGVQKMT